jgi:hypothetical protein
VSHFSPGGTRFDRREGRNRCIWREDSLLMHLLRTTVNVPPSLRSSIENWEQISMELREPRRRRSLQIENLEEQEVFLF